MIIVLRAHTPEDRIAAICQRVVDHGYEPRLIQGVERTVIAAVGDETSHRSLEDLESLPEVEQVMPVQKRYKLASREYHSENTVAMIGDQPIGAGHFMHICGPCSVESEEQMHQVAQDLQAAGIRVLRGGAYKPRTSPYDFQGMGPNGLAILADIKKAYGMAIVTEVLAVNHVEAVAEVADLLQIGARNCQNYNLLEVAGATGRPVMLKRGLATRIDEWILAAEYLLVHGAPTVILCERGIRTFEPATRFTLDVSAVAVARRETHLPILVDPSHPAGKAELVLPLARAAIAAGADGLMIETHPCPSEALSDAAQQLPSAEMADVIAGLQPLIDLCEPWRKGPC